jgi:hypothetical protein
MDALSINGRPRQGMKGFEGGFKKLNIEEQV